MNHHALLCSAICSSTSFEHWSQPLHIRVSVSRKYSGRSRSCANTQTSQPLVRDPLPNTQITVDLTAYLAIHLIHHTEDAVNGDSNASAKKVVYDTADGYAEPSGGSCATDEGCRTNYRLISRKLGCRACYKYVSGFYTGCTGLSR